MYYLDNILLCLVGTFTEKDIVQQYKIQFNNTKEREKIRIQIQKKYQKLMNKMIL